LKRRISICYFISVLVAVSVGGCGGFFYHPDREKYFDPHKNGFNPQDVWFTAGDGAKLHGWWFAVPNAVGTIVQFHGNAENLTSHFASLAWLTRERYNLFIFDYRGYGQSPGNPDAAGLYLDGMAALDTAWDLHQRTSRSSNRFVVFAQSLGVIVATRAFSDFQHRDATWMLVLDSGFCSFKDLVQEKMADIWITWPFSPLGRLSVSDRYACRSVLPSLRVPTLVIHDENDPVVDIRNSEMIFDALTQQEKHFWRISEGRHVAVFAIDQPNRRKLFLDLLSSRLARVK